jgi:hypothetical protein
MKTSPSVLFILLEGLLFIITVFLHLPFKFNAQAMMLTAYKMDPKRRNSDCIDFEYRELKNNIRTNV